MLWRFSFLCWTIHRGGSRTAATSKMERFVITVNGWKPLAIITKLSISDVAAVLDPPLSQMINAMVYLWSWNNSTYMTIFLIPYFLLQVWKTVILDLEKTCLFHSKTVINSKKNRCRYLYTFWLLCFILTCCKVLAHFCYSFNFQPSIFCKSVF